jgi:hypothetical protein
MNCVLLTLFRAPKPAFHNDPRQQPASPLYASRPAEADSDLSIFYDNRYVPSTLGELQHLVKLGPVHLHIEEFSLVSEGFTSLDRIRSTLFSVNDDLAYHGRPPMLKGNFYNYILSFYECKSKLFTIESVLS